MEREQFTFYRSFWEALKALPEEDKLPFVMSVCAYAFDEESEPVAGHASAAFLLVKPILDKASKKAESGRTGGSKRKAKPKSASSKPKANGKQTESHIEGEKEKEGEIEIEVEDECLIGARDGNDPGLASVMDAYMNRIDPTPSPSSMDELKGYVTLMGPEVCIRAIDAALNAKAANWNYIRRVLMNKASQGVRCIADWDALEAKREAQKVQAAPQQPGGRTDWAALAAQMEQEGTV